LHPDLPPRCFLRPFWPIPPPTFLSFDFPPVSHMTPSFHLPPFFVCETPLQVGNHPPLLMVTLPPCSQYSSPCHSISQPFYPVLCALVVDSVFRPLKKWPHRPTKDPESCLFAFWDNPRSAWFPEDAGPARPVLPSDTPHTPQPDLIPTSRIGLSPLPLMAEFFLFCFFLGIPFSFFSVPTHWAGFFFSLLCKSFPSLSPPDSTWTRSFLPFSWGGDTRGSVFFFHCFFFRRPFPRPAPARPFLPVFCFCDLTRVTHDLSHFRRRLSPQPKSS